MFLCRSAADIFCNREGKYKVVSVHSYKYTNFFTVVFLIRLLNYSIYADLVHTLFEVFCVPKSGCTLELMAHAKWETTISLSVGS